MKNLYNPNKELLKFVAAGSVDDGKSTLIGRLLYDIKGIYQDQLEAVIRDSQQDSDEENIDFSLLTDGLSAEREQKITIDVAYRYFSTPKRKFIIIDVPGHEQYTRNMITGASNANLALILIDARKGLRIQSKRHLFLANSLGMSHILMVVNKMDLVGYQEEVFQKIKNQVAGFASKLNIKDLRFIPVSSVNGDMVVKRGRKMDWYDGQTVLNYLESLYIASDRNLIDFRFPVQLVVKEGDFRGYAGQVKGGVISKSEEVVVLPSGKRTEIKSITIGKKKADYAFNPQSVILALKDDLDVSRGNMIVRCNNLPEVGNKFEAMIFWMSEEPMEANKNYILKQTTKTVRCSATQLRYKINIDNLHRKKSDSLKLNEIGRAYFKTLEPIMYDFYERNKHTGSFILIDEFSNNTVGAGIIWRNIQKLKSCKNKLN